MSTTTTELELSVGEGIGISPGSDWRAFADEILNPGAYGSLTEQARLERYTALGVWVGQFVTHECQTTEKNYAHIAAGRFTQDITSDLHVMRRNKEAEALRRGYLMGINIAEMILEGRVA